MAPSPGKHRVVVAGGGIAALEAVLALRRLAGDRVELDLVTPEPELVYRPLAVVEPFGLGEAPRFDLAAIARDQDFRLHGDSVAEVDPNERLARTTAGEELAYDSLVIATGAHPEPAVPGAFTYRGPPDGPQLRSQLRRIEEGEISDVVFAVPEGVAWPLPLYEIALMTAALIAGKDGAARLAVATPEPAPLAVFGREASESVAGLLRERGVAVHVSSAPVAVEDGRLMLVPKSSIPADLVVALPRLRGTPVPGLPHDSDGFLPVDRDGRVENVESVYAAGDATSFPIKQGGIAAQQADAVAREIAAATGAPVKREPFRPVLRGLLLTGKDARFMRSEIAGGHGDAGQVSDHMLWWPETKIAGQYISAYLANKIDPIQPKAPLAPDAIPVEVDLTEAASGG
jgi:sulfide:quinone oxidoreductase